jgi:anti-sigma-K factor RskA
MAQTPVDGHTDEFEELAALAALDVLEGEDLARFEQHAADCERCRLVMRLDREALSGLALIAPEMEPSPDFKARLMLKAADELRERQQREPLPFQPRSRPTNVVPLWRRSPWLNAIAALFVVALVSLGAFTYSNQPVTTVVLSGSAPGNAVVVVRRSGAADLELQGLPDPGPGFLYEAWIIPPGRQPVAAGVLNGGSGRVSLEGDPRGATVAITRERSRVNAPTSEPVLAGTVQS